MAKKQNFIRHFFVIGSGTAINMLIGLLTAPVITRMVDPVEYGQLSMFTLYATLAVMILGLGMDQALVRFYYEQDTLEYRRALLLRCVRLPVIITLCLSAAVVASSALGLVSYEFSTPVMVLLCVCTLIQLLYRFSQLLVRLAYRSREYSMLNVLHKLAYVVLAVGLLLVMKEHDLLALVLATVLSYGLCMALSIRMQPREWDFRAGCGGRSAIHEQELLRYAAPFILSMSVTQLFHAIDKLSLNHFCTYAEVGVYSSAMTLVHIFAIVQTSFNAVWAPMQVEHYTKNPQDHSFYQKGNQAITVVMFLLGLSLMLFKDVFAVLLGGKYREAAAMLPFLAFNPIMYTVSETTCGGLVFMKKSRMQVVVALGACVTNIIGNALLVPVLGGRGAAISTGVSYLVFFTLRTALANRYFYTDFRLKQFYAMTGITCVYAYANTFFSFGVWSVIGYMLSVAALLLLYRDTVQWGAHELTAMLRRRKRS